MDNHHDQKQTFWGIRYEFLICLFLVLTTTVVYHQVTQFEFVSFDDHLYVSDNHPIQSGLTVQNILWAFTDATQVTNYWAPLTWLSFMVDYQFFDLNPGGYHLSNLLFHMLNAVLLFHVLRKMTGKMWQSSLVAFLFALHPLHVESVAWVTERKDVLCALFWILTLWSYQWYAGQPGISRYLFVMLMFFLGLMAKPMIVTLPFVLLLLDYWPLKRFQNERIKEDLDTGLGSLFRLGLEKLPFIPIIAISSITTFVTQQHEGAVVPLDAVPLGLRLINSVNAYAVYIQKMIWPHPLAFLYPYPDAQPLGEIILDIVILVSISVFAIRYAKRFPWCIVGWLWYLGTLVPVIGLVVIGPYATADRYTYIPLIGLFIIVAWGAFEVFEKWKKSKVWLAVAACMILFVFMMVSWRQTRHWQNSFSLYQHALEVTDNNFIAHNNLGIVLAEQGRIEEAITHYRAALKIKKNNLETRSNLGVLLAKQGRLEDAIHHYSEVLRINPNLSGTHNNLGRALAELGKTDEAVFHFREALRLAPDDPVVHENLGKILEDQGDIYNALKHYIRSLHLSNRRPDMLNNIGAALLKIGRIKEAIGHFYAALDLNPDHADAHNNLGVALASQGNTIEAMQHFREALRLNPNHEEARNNLNQTAQN